MKFRSAFLCLSLATVENAIAIDCNEAVKSPQAYAAATLEQVNEMSSLGGNTSGNKWSSQSSVHQLVRVFGGRSRALRACQQREIELAQSRSAAGDGRTEVTQTEAPSRTPTRGFRPHRRSNPVHSQSTGRNPEDPQALLARLNDYWSHLAVGGELPPSLKEDAPDGRFCERAERQEVSLKGAYDELAPGSVRHHDTETWAFPYVVSEKTVCRGHFLAVAQIALTKDASGTWVIDATRALAKGPVTLYYIDGFINESGGRSASIKLYNTNGEATDARNSRTAMRTWLKMTQDAWTAVYGTRQSRGREQDLNPPARFLDLRGAFQAALKLGDISHIEIRNVPADQDVGADHFWERDPNGAHPAESFYLNAPAMFDTSQVKLRHYAGYGTTSPTTGTLRGLDFGATLPGVGGVVKVQTIENVSGPNLFQNTDLISYYKPNGPLPIAVMTDFTVHVINSDEVLSRTVMYPVALNY
jgi:hypothetical protein